MVWIVVGILLVIVGDNMRQIEREIAGVLSFMATALGASMILAQVLAWFN